MAFWGVEVKAGVPLKVEPEEEASIHLSQVALGELKKNEIVSVFATVDGQKLVLGHLSAEKMPQLSFDLVFDREFELSHNSKSSVFFIGYQAPPVYETDSDDEEDEHDHELVHFTNAANDDKKAPATAPKPNNVKPDSSSKQKSKSAQPVKGESESDDSDEDDSDDESGDSESDDEEGSEEGMSVDSGEDDSDSEDEETPKKAGKGSSNKRPIDSATETPVQAKKQKSATPQKSEGKKSVHTATPHPAKGKTSANGPTAKSGINTKPQTTPKSDGKFSCGSCDRAFGSDAALQSHSKAKHSAK